MTSKTHVKHHQVLIYYSKHKPFLEQHEHEQATELITFVMSSNLIVRSVVIIFLITKKLFVNKRKTVQPTWY